MNIKRLRQFSNMTLLCVTSDENLHNQIKDIFSDIKEFICTDDIDEIISLKYDILVIDYNVKNGLKILDEINKVSPLVPKIAIISEVDDKVILSCINRTVTSIISHPLNSNDLKLSVIVALNKSKRADKIFLANGIYYDAYRERFYDKEGAIAFTKFEFGLLKLLLDNPNRIIEYDEIQKEVWKEKKMSIFTMRNVINKIRKKTYYDIIKNKSSKGYQIDSFK